MHPFPPTASPSAQPPPGALRVLIWRVFVWTVSCGLLCVPAAPAADLRITVDSSSRQFTVRGQSVGHVQDASTLSPDFILLDPALLAVTCEKVRHALAIELGWKPAWQGHIFIELHPAGGPLKGVVTQPVRTARGWEYRMDMPDETSPLRLVQALVEVLLMEYSDRSAKERHGEFPPWLVPGLVAAVQAGSPAGLVLAPNRLISSTNILKNPFESVRPHLGRQALLTVDQLNWPEPGQFDEERMPQYEASAHLLVRQLLRLPNGPACLNEMLACAPEYLNWQTAFFRAFQPHFQRLVDLGKWWSLITADFQTRDPLQVWSLAESRQRLDEILYTPVQVRLEKDAFPHDSFLSLADVLMEWDFARQTAVLQPKVLSLADLKGHLSPEVASLAEEYRHVLENYLRARDRARSAPAAGARTFVTDRVILTTALSALQGLDARRERLWNPDTRLSSVKPAKSPPARGPGPVRRQP
jgi:hypothetical protein